MKKLTRILLASLLAFGPVHADDDLWEAKGPHIRIKRNDQDGSYIVFERSPDDRVLTKETRDENHKVKMLAKYHRDLKGFLSVGEIFDGRGTKIWRVTYGYHRETAQLVAENMYDARVKNYYPPEIRDDNGNRVEMPIRRVYYFYDADGNQSKAISLVPNPGKTAKDVFTRTKKTLHLFGEEPNFNADTSTNPNLNNPFVEEKEKEKAKKNK